MPVHNIDDVPFAPAHYKYSSDSHRAFARDLYSLECTALSETCIAFQARSYEQVSRKTLGKMVSDEIIYKGQTFVFDYAEPETVDTSDYGYDGRDEKWVESSAPVIDFVFKPKGNKND